MDAQEEAEKDARFCQEILLSLSGTGRTLLLILPQLKNSGFGLDHPGLDLDLQEV